jgi:hypothetical protein
LRHSSHSKSHSASRMPSRVTYIKCLQCQWRPFKIPGNHAHFQCWGSEGVERGCSDTL